jgi:hypothetical protein
MVLDVQMLRASGLWRTSELVLAVRPRPPPRRDIPILYRPIPSVQASEPMVPETLYMHRVTLCATESCDFQDSWQNVPERLREIPGLSGEVRLVEPDDSEEMM